MITTMAAILARVEERFAKKDVALNSEGLRSKGTTIVSPGEILLDRKLKALDFFIWPFADLI
jgi:hypothetical protein